MTTPAFRILVFLAGGALFGALLGYFGQCSNGSCPLTSTWWRGALYGAGLGVLLAFASFSPR